MKVELQPAYLLHSRPYRDSSALVDFLTLDYGLLRAVARGMRGAKNRSGHNARLQQHQPLLLSAAGRGELLTVNQLECAAPGFVLTGHFLFSALYLNELLVRLLQPAEPHPALYRLYQNTLIALHQQDSLEPTLRQFEWGLLDDLGYGLDLTTIEPGCRYHFNALDGFSVMIDHRQPAFDGDILVRLAEVFGSAGAARWPEDEAVRTRVLRTCKHLMRAALQIHLGDKPLLSRRLFADLGHTREARLPSDTDSR